MRDVWRYVSLVAGALCVMMDGITEMLRWSAGNWDIQLKVRSMINRILCKKSANYCLIHVSQMLRLFTMPVMGRELHQLL